MNFSISSSAPWSPTSDSSSEAFLFAYSAAFLSKFANAHHHTCCNPCLPDLAEEKVGDYLLSAHPACSKNRLSASSDSTSQPGSSSSSFELLVNPDANAEGGAACLGFRISSVRSLSKISSLRVASSLSTLHTQHVCKCRWMQSRQTYALHAAWLKSS